MNIAQLIKEQALQRPYQKAVVFPTGRDSQGRVVYSHYTFAALLRDADHLAWQLKARGIVRGTKTLLFVRPSLEFPLITFALFKLGAIPVLIDPGMGRQNLLRSIEQVGPAALIAAPQVHFLRRLLPGVFRTVKLAITSARWGFALAEPLRHLLPAADTRLTPACEPFLDCELSAEDPAAILFTSGGTGPPKGVLYTHGIFAHQVATLKAMFKMDERDKDLPGFPLFAMMSMAMGVTCVIPPLDPTQPAKANAAKLIETILDHGVTMVNGSPAIWERVGRYCKEHRLELPSVRGVLMFGAPVSNALHELFAPLLPNGTSYSPYGATECLPVSLISGQTVLAKTAGATSRGCGTCVGQAVVGLSIRIIRAWQGPLPDWESVEELGAYEIGEIIVAGKQVTPAYYEMPEATARAKIRDHQGQLWHRMGDLGYLDHEGQLWFCGRHVHQVTTSQGPLYSVNCEAIFNAHPAVRRTALIGLPTGPDRAEAKPCLVIERCDGRTELDASEAKEFTRELLALGQSAEHTRTIQTFYLHKSFPVDTRHNIKIDRLSLQSFYTRRENRSL